MKTADFVSYAARQAKRVKETKAEDETLRGANVLQCEHGEAECLPSCMISMAVPSPRDQLNPVVVAHFAAENNERSVDDEHPVSAHDEALDGEGKNSANTPVSTADDPRKRGHVYTAGKEYAAVEENGGRPSSKRLKNGG